MRLITNNKPRIALKPIKTSNKLPDNLAQTKRNKPMTGKEKLAKSVRQYVFEMLDAEPNFNGMEAGQVAHAIEMAFNATLYADKPRWAIGDEYQPVGKHKARCIITDIVRTFDENGQLRITYVSQHEFLGQTVTNYNVSETTVARGRFCNKRKKIIETGEIIYYHE